MLSFTGNLIKILINDTRALSYVILKLL